eukprot:jgi/Botrbrau1/20611/Bobra.113_1s0037.1
MAAEASFMLSTALCQTVRSPFRKGPVAPQSLTQTCRCAVFPGSSPQSRNSFEQKLPSNMRKSLRLKPYLRVAAAEPIVQAASSVGDIYVPYETMIVLRPDMSEEERDVELAKFEAFLVKEGAQDVKALVRGNQSLAYPIKGYWEAVYVLYSYTGKRSISQAVQKLLSTPIVGAESNVLRHMTFVN